MFAGEVRHVHGAARDRTSQSMQLCCRMLAVEHVPVWLHERGQEDGIERACPHVRVG